MLEILWDSESFLKILKDARRFLKMPGDGLGFLEIFRHVFGGSSRFLKILEDS